MAEESRRALLEAAFDKVEEEEKVETPAVEVEAEAKPSETPVEEKDDAYKVEAEAAKKPDAEPKVEAKPAETPKPAEQSDRAPISWKAEEKALWDKVPAEVRSIIQRRELETQRALSSSAQARRFAEDFGKVVSPYAHLIRAQNSTPIQAVDNLMRTAAGLTVGTQEQKAAIVSEIINNYGVDLQVLDAVLAKTPVPATAGQASLPPQFAQALQPVYQFMEQVQQNRQSYEQRVQQEAATSVEQFGANKPFFDEVREDMADLMEVAARRGRVLSLDDAYKQAIAMNPQFSAAVNQNQKANEVSQAAATLARARRAASSVRGGPQGGSMGQKTPTSRRESLEQAWEDSQR